VGVAETVFTVRGQRSRSLSDTLTYSVSQKSSPLKTLFDIFSCGEPV